ncbi:hypothetical protein HDU76_003541 [Blyttiomyces sp. JEL0837]|nr:hypothetical protein HDU76_003541 [Blyttiomyces sp. JEL0837]
MLQLDEDLEEVYGWTFQIEYADRFSSHGGGRKYVDLVPNGASVKLTRTNRNEFVDRYKDFVLDKIVKGSFEAFLKGFESVVDGNALALFRPEEFRQLAVGSPLLDLKGLEKSAQYEGWDADSVTIKHFWEIVHAMTEDEKKKLLIFTTGSDRVPVGGLSKLQFVIARNGPDSERLPTSHTCYNVLLLNEYSTKERLEEKLKTALRHAHCGFYLL